MQHCGKCPDAVAQIRGGIDAPQLSGCVQFYQESGCVLVMAKISGLPMESETGFYGFHIHQGESCSGMEFSATGSHYNPSNQPHPKHAGDLPPLLACQGKCIFVCENRSVFGMGHYRADCCDSQQPG